MSARSPFQQNISPDREERQRNTSALLFDLDGTLMDSNYEHVAAWRLALRRAGVEVPNAFIHSCIGMRGDLLLKAAYKGIGKEIGQRTIEKLEKLHKTHFEKILTGVRPLPGAAALLKALTRRKVPWAIATGGDQSTVLKMLRPLGVVRKAPVVTADDVGQAKPEPDVFLVAARRLGMALSVKIGAEATNGCDADGL